MTTVLNQSIEERNQEEAGIVNNTVYDEDDDRLDEYLVEEVRKYRLLWDTSARGYKYIVKKNQAWTDISLRLKASGM